jgi:hypothetical protein
MKEIGDSNSNDAGVPQPSVEVVVEERQYVPVETFGDAFDFQAYGFPNLEALKADAREGLGLPADFPMTVRSETLEGKVGAVFSGPAPAPWDPQSGEPAEPDRGSVTGVD